jgi:hypothetical protein
MPAPYAGNPAQYPASIDCPVDADPPNAIATTRPLEQLADRTANISLDLPKTTLSNLWQQLQRFVRGIQVSNTQANQPGVSAAGGPGTGAGIQGTGNGNGQGVVGVGAGTGPGIEGSSANGPGGLLHGNASRAALNLAPQAVPAQAVDGDVFISQQDGTVQMRTQGSWGDVVLTGKPTIAPVILNGAASDDSPSRQIAALPAARKLIDEMVNSAGQRTRIYSTPNGLELITNAAWSSANRNWVPDTPNTAAATRTSFGATGINFRAMVRPANPFTDADWEDATKVKGFTLGSDADIVWQGEHAVGAAGEPPFHGAWAAISPLYFIKDATGIVHLNGIIGGGLLGNLSPIFTLPVGYLPNHPVYLPVITASAFTMSQGITPGVIVIVTTGDVYLAVGDTRCVFIDLQFRAGF